MPHNETTSNRRTTAASSSSTTPWSELSPPSQSSSKDRKDSDEDNMNDQIKVLSDDAEDQPPPANPNSTCTTSESQMTLKAPSNKEEDKAAEKTATIRPKAATHDSKIPDVIVSTVAGEPKRRQRSSKQPKKASERKRNPAPSDSSDSTSSPEDSGAPQQAKAGKNEKAKPQYTDKRIAKPKKTPPMEKAETSTDTEDDSPSPKGKIMSKKKKKQPKSEKARTKAKAKSTTKDGSCSDSNDETSEAEVKVRKTKPKIGESSVIGGNFSTLLNEQSLAQFTTVHLRDATFERIPAGPATAMTEKIEEEEASEEESKEKVKKGSKAEFARVDLVYSTEKHRFILQNSTEDKKAGQFHGYAFNIIRRFDYHNKYLSTALNILSGPLKIAMVHVMRNVKGISLEEETPKIDPNMVFLHLEELRAYLMELKVKIKAKKTKSKIEELKLSRQHLKVLVEYLDKDYDETKKSLYPLIKSGKITFELAWALFKSNEIVYTNTYGHEDEPRAAKIEYVHKASSIMEGDSYVIEVRFLDYDGTRFGMSKAIFDIPEFKGPRKISSLPVYPLAYHKDSEVLKGQLIERGKKFVGLAGMQYRLQKGIAFHKKDKKIIKVNVNGRVMIDPATFRRLRPNYQFSSIIRDDKDLLSDSESEGEIEEIDEESSSSDDDASQSDPLKDDSDTRDAKEYKKWKKNHKKKLVRDPDNPEGYHIIWVKINKRVPEDVEALPKQPAEEDSTTPSFTDEEYLIANPVALGFSFSEKMWLEFAVSGINEIQWNAGAFDSLIIPDDQKTVVRALVESHAFEAKKNIDDVIQGKGRGLVAVLHGPPGTGKTLTAEGIAELLRKPLYAVSVGELGIRSNDVERNLNQILDVAHTWGALLLLDEADVFLEERTSYDVSRNALVSIFLRMLEYFQGILFLTTNRVTVFDPAFASRIHIGLRYGELSVKARKQVWRMFMGKVAALEGVEVEDIGEEGYKRLGGFELNGREIKNAVRTAQSVALINKETLGMKHLLQVLLVGEVFAKDLKGPGYEEALKFYM